jgi:hypothetical protein
MRKQINFIKNQLYFSLYKIILNMNYWIVYIIIKLVKIKNNIAHLQTFSQFSNINLLLHILIKIILKYIYILKNHPICIFNYQKRLQ